MTDQVISRWINWGTGPDQVNARVIPGNYAPLKYIAAQVAAEGNDKLSAHLKGIDTALVKMGDPNILWVKVRALTPLNIDISGTIGLEIEPKTSILISKTAGNSSNGGTFDLFIWG